MEQTKNIYPELIPRLEEEAPFALATILETNSPAEKGFPRRMHFSSQRSGRKRGSARKGMIWAVVLAAGESRRMGGPKLLLPFGSSTIIETVIRRLLASRVDKLLVVLGASARPIREKIKEFPVKTVLNRRFHRGMLSSVQCGIAALPASAEAAVIALADQPAISPEVLNSLISAYSRKRKRIVVPVYRGERGHPLLLDLNFRREIMALDPAIGLRQLLERHPDDVFEVRISSPAVLHDIDNADDYLSALGRTGRKKKGGFNV
ncbi:MAG: nucleotidyltransferase family protein [Acidobacteriota bacterium]